MRSILVALLLVFATPLLANPFWDQLAKIGDGITESAINLVESISGIPGNTTTVGKLFNVTGDAFVTVINGTNQLSHVLTDNAGVITDGVTDGASVLGTGISKPGNLTTAIANATSIVANGIFNGTSGAVVNGTTSVFKIAESLVEDITGNDRP